MEKAIQLSDDLGIRVIQLAGYDVYYEEGSEQTRKDFADNLKKAVEMAAVHGVVLGFETMETEFMNTVAKSMKYVDLIDNPYLGVYPDVGNLTNAAKTYGTSVLDDLLGQQSLERSEYDGSVSNAQNWRDYLSGRVDTARQENSDFWNNVWNVVKGVGNAVKTGYDAYQGYYQWDKEFELQKQQYADSLQRTQLSDQISAMEQAQAFKQAGFDDLAAQTLTKYGLDSTMLDAWEGMSDTQKDKMAALLQGASLAGSGNDTAAKNYLQMAGLSGDSTDSYGTIAGRLNSSNLAYQQALLGLQQRYKTTGTGSTRSGGSSSGSKSGGYTISQLQQMANKFSSMKGTEPLYDFYKRTLINAGWIKADTGTKASTQSAAGGTGAGKAGTTTSKLPAATTKTPWSTSGTVDGVAGASVSMASPKGGNYNTALREAQQMANNGYDMAQITEYLIRKNYSDSTISQVSQTMGW